MNVGSDPMSRFRIVLALALIAACGRGVQAADLDPALAPGQNFDLHSYRLQTLDDHLQFKQVSPIGSYQDPFFFTQPGAGAMNFRVPSGAGHTGGSEFPRVELREIDSWMMGLPDGALHRETIRLRVVSEPATGRLIFAQIHGEEISGTELLKMRWSHGEIIMAVKKHPGDGEEKISLLRGLTLGDAIECRLELINEKLTVNLRSGDRAAERSFDYDKESWKNVPLYFKAGNYAQDKDVDGSAAIVSIERLELAR
jgi:Alginate lyase